MWQSEDRQLQLIKKENCVQRTMKKETKNHRLVHVHVHHTAIMSLPYISHPHILSFHVCTLHRFVACFGIHRFFSCMPAIFFPVLIFNRISYQRFTSHFARLVCMLLLPLFPFKNDKSLRSFLLFKWARTITSLSGVRVCLCVAFSSVVNFMHLLQRVRNVWSYLLSPTYKEKQPDRMIDIIFVSWFYWFFLSLSLCVVLRFLFALQWNSAMRQ